ncbi:MT-A70-domain-containing protein [Cladorrhinum samala]|uniref:MT-A70-domain-containing protein n=1 Tax=Cladorrhinum samala TaxID=585594 RepID=A0AAV9HA12_9PEZI|nr:MT-A70-domain-containing protein [Cladorrhinum samala]
MTPFPPPSCILWQNNSQSTILIDIPRSIEEAQHLSSYSRGHLTSRADDEQPLKHVGPDKTPPFRRLISAVAPALPFPTPEPKPGGRYQSAATTSQSAQLAELMTLATVESALDDIRTSYNGPWCLPRITSKPVVQAKEKKRPVRPEGNTEPKDSTAAIIIAASTSIPASTLPPDPVPSSHYIPPDSTPLNGSISSLRTQFLTLSPRFSLVILDPPWPNRSAKRKRSGSDSYSSLPSLTQTQSLLSSIPVPSCLLPDGLVAVWITNAPRFHTLLTSIIFPEWDVELVGEWVWLKVTSEGEPIVSLESQWRRPWERLVLGRRKGGVTRGAVKGKVILGVPDMHSRKPNLRKLFEEAGLVERGYKGLEVFARHLTAGWWGWGDECLKFQGREWWVAEGECEDRGADGGREGCCEGEEGEKVRETDISYRLDTQSFASPPPLQEKMK